MKIVRRILAGIAILLSVLVILLCLVGIVGIWVSSRAVNAGVQDLLGGVQSAARFIENDVNRIDSGLEDLRSRIGTIEANLSKLSQNVIDQGVIRTLLPEEQDQALTAKVQSIQAAAVSSRDKLEAVKGMLLAISQLPFLNLPDPDYSRLQALKDQVNGLAADVQKSERLDPRVPRGHIRIHPAGQETAVSTVDQHIEYAQTQVAQFHAKLQAIDDRAARLMTTLPFFLTIGSGGHQPDSGLDHLRAIRPHSPVLENRARLAQSLIPRQNKH